MRTPTEEEGGKASESAGWRRPFGRPIGVFVIAVLLTVKGLISIGIAVGILSGSTEPGLGAELEARGVPTAIALTIVGLLLLHRASALWAYRRSAWLVTTLVMAGALVADASVVSAAPGVPIAWVNLMLSASVLVYLLMPGTRSQFAPPAHRRR